MKVYLFDVDHTLEVSGGPVTIKSMIELKDQGHIIGICGNWTVFVARVQGWQHLISLQHPFHLCYYNEKGERMDKTDFMKAVRQYLPAEDYVMIGNSLRDKEKIPNISDDEGAAFRADWKFIKEENFANGER